MTRSTQFGTLWYIQCSLFLAGSFVSVAESRRSSTDRHAEEETAARQQPQQPQQPEQPRQPAKPAKPATRGKLFKIVW